ncbi:GTPase HflX, partial [bacterium]|nr:GTPase HflX [bacterium]
ISSRSDSDWDIDDNMRELILLCETAGLEVTEKVSHIIRDIAPRSYIGKGKADSIARSAHSNNADCIVFDIDLSPSQARNLEKIIGRKIIDRSGLILDIFAKNARTKEAKTQVELAQLNYLLPRLTGHWTHLSRQEGGVGIGLRGPGETQLEVDKRIVRKKIKKLSDSLDKIEKRRIVKSKKRQNFFRSALIGYTNTGKSTLLNALTEADVLVEDKLFATLDSTVRKVTIKNHYDILLSDTVGFIKNLPHHLIASFKSTLGEARDADVLLHVADISHPRLEEQIVSVNEVLQSLDIRNKPTIMVFNKLDLSTNDEVLRRMKSQYKNAVFISALRGIGLKTLVDEVIKAASMDYIEDNIEVPIADYNNINKIKKIGTVISTEFNDGYVSVHYRTRKEYSGKVRDILAGEGK